MEKLEHTKFLIIYYLFGLFWDGKDNIELCFGGSCYFFILHKNSL